MNYTDEIEEDSQPELGKSSLVIRFPKRQPRQKSSPVPVTELQYKIRGPRIDLGKLLRIAFNILFLGVLSVVLLALIAAFAYALINHPTEMGKWASDLVAGVQGVVQGLAEIIR